MANLRFGKLIVVRGTTPHLPFQFSWEDDGSARSVAGSVVTLRAYNADGSLLFSRVGVPSGVDPSQVTVTLTTTDTATPGQYYGELELRTTGAPDDVQMWLGTISVDGPG